MLDEDKKWQADSDARTLAEADAIRKDEERLNRASAAANELAKEKRDEAVSMSAIANQQVFAKSAKALGINDNAEQKT